MENWRPDPDSNRGMTVLQTVALANLAIGPHERTLLSLDGALETLATSPHQIRAFGRYVGASVELRRAGFGTHPCGFVLACVPENINLR